MSEPEIVVISLVKNEDLYIRKVIDGVIDFCDEMIILDNMSNDNTYDILTEVSNEYKDKIKLHRLENIRESSKFTKPYMNTNSWLLAVDGDEIYDKHGLKKMREELKGGRFKDKWAVSGYFLNCTDVNWDKKIAKGYMSPPSRPCVRLYNFKAIHKWSQKKHRMHGGRPRFNRGYSLKSRYSMHEHLSWEESYLRYLHVCFVERSSKDPDKCRINPSEVLMGKRKKSKYKMKKYHNGDLLTVDIRDF